MLVCFYAVISLLGTGPKEISRDVGVKIYVPSCISWPCYRGGDENNLMNDRVTVPEFRVPGRKIMRP